MKIFVAVADHHLLIRAAICDAIEKIGFSILFVADSGDEMIQKIATIGLPAVCAIDADLPYGDGFATGQQIKKKWPSVKIVIMALFPDNKMTEQFRESGADAILSKSAGFVEIRNTFSRLLEGYLDDELFARYN
ncbi:MAG: response regulator [Chitinophagaceae bacterium]